MIDALCKDVMQCLGIHTFVETGTDMAETVAELSRWSAEWDPKFGRITDSVKTGARAYNTWNEEIVYPQFDNVKDSRFKIHSVDVDPYSYKTARQLFETNSNIKFHLQSSEIFLRSFIQKKLDSPSDDDVFFFLDAHWGKRWPLRDELREVSRLRRFAVCIDDVFVPRKSSAAKPHGDFGYDVYRGTVLDWAYIRPALQHLDAKVLYSVTSNRDRRGWMLILAGYSEQELSALDWNRFYQLDVDDPIHTRPVKLHPTALLDFRNMIKRVLPLRFVRASIRVYQRLT